MRFANQERHTHPKDGQEPNLMVNNLTALNADGKVILIRNLLRAIKSTGISRLITYNGRGISFWMAKPDGMKDCFAILKIYFVGGQLPQGKRIITK